MNDVIEPDQGSDKMGLSDLEKQTLNSKIAQNVNQKIKKEVNSIDIYDQRISMREMKNIKQSV